MIPLMARLRVHSPKFNVSLWLPLFLIWLVLLPMAIVLLPLALVICVLFGNNPFPALAAGWQLLCGLRGTHVEIDEPEQSVLLAIS
jgi:hypothetical protein